MTKPKFKVTDAFASPTLGTVKEQVPGGCYLLGDLKYLLGKEFDNDNTYPVAELTKVRDGVWAFRASMLGCSITDFNDKVIKLPSGVIGVVMFDALNQDRNVAELFKECDFYCADPERTVNIEYTERFIKLHQIHISPLILNLPA